jgi:hypothetical protein
VAQSKNRPSDDEIAQRIGEILEAIRTPEHADDIIEIRKIVRKNVPFFFRSYFAYLLKDSLMGGFKSGPRDRDRNGRNQPKREQQPRDQLRDSGRDQGKKVQNQEPKQKQNRPEPKTGRQDKGRQDGARQNDAGLDGERSEERKNERMAPLPEGVEAATLFVSAGRKRHFYPRHLLELFVGADIPRESIGEIRLFDNYTFVQIIASDAAKAVANLDGAVFKGRKLTVNFARKKDEATDELTSSDEGASRDEIHDDPAANVDRGYGDEEANDELSSSDADASFDDTIDDESDYSDAEDEFEDEPEGDSDSDKSDPTEDA